MKHTSMLAALLVCGISSALSAATPPGGVGGKSAVEIVPGRVQVVMAKGAPPVVRYAADELANVLARTLNSSVPVVNAPSASKTNVILGSNSWSSAEGLDAGSVARDGFIIGARGSSVYLLGMDDPQVDPRATFTGRVQLLSGFQRGTLNAVYAFLERYADARFFFPGELGTCYASKERISVPEGVERVEPVFTERYFSAWSIPANAWPDKSVSMSKITADEWLRLRFASIRTVCSHGQRYFRYVPRFAKEHPDWFCLTSNGKRCLTDLGERSSTGKDLTYFNSKLCYTSPIREELYQDVKAYLTGKPASSRGLDRWGPNCAEGRYVDIMPEDGFKECFCPNCQKAYEKKKHPASYASNLMWGLTAEIASRLTREGVKGDVVQMAYNPFSAVPDFSLPTNVQVMVAVGGPWSAANEKEINRQMSYIKSWRDCLGHKVWLWTYPGKYNGSMPGVPEIAPRAYAQFFSRAAENIFGAYACNDTDRFSFELLNLYAFAKLCWNPGLDINELLDDWHSRLFGLAKDDMKAAFDLLERKWIYEVCSGKVSESALGPVKLMPSEGRLWANIYSAKTIDTLERLFDAGVSKVPPGSLEARRIAFFRSELLGSIVETSRRADPATALARRKKENRPSMIANGDFDSLAGWTKSVPWGTMELDTADKVAGRASVRITSDSVPHPERNVQGDCCVPVSLVKGAKYRISYFMKTKDVIPYNTKGGAALHGANFCLWMTGPYYMKEPAISFHGSCNWVYQEYEFAAPVDAPHAKLQFRLEDSLGTMWVDGVRFERLDRGGAGDAIHHGKHGNAPSCGTERAEEQTFHAFQPQIAHFKNQYVEDGRMAAQCPKVSFSLFSVSRKRGFQCVLWS